MNCPQCKRTMEFQDRICRRCNYCIDLQRFVTVEAPRARSRRGVHRISILKRAVIISGQVNRDLHRDFGVKPIWVLAAGFIPGAGHVLVARTWEGLFFSVSIVALAWIACLSSMQTVSSLTLLGTACGLHMVSLLRLSVVVEHEKFLRRVVTNLVLVGLLIVLVYRPLTSFLMQTKPEYVNVPMYRGPDWIPAFGNFWSLVGVLIISWVGGQVFRIFAQFFTRRRS